MPNTKTAKRELRVAEKRHMRNKSVKAMTKTQLTGAEKLITAGDIDAAKAAVTSAISALDKEAQKGVVHRNNAARHKSRLVKKLNKVVAQPKAEAPKTEQG